MIPPGRAWQPLRPRDLARILGGLPAPWWIAGGWAIDLFLETQTRAHEDTDLVVLRRDQFILQRHLARWRLEIPDAVAFRPWRWQETLDVGADSVWCRPREGTPWSFEVMFMDSDDDHWVYRRAPAVRGPLADLGRRSPEGWPYLAPQVQLLYKAKHWHQEKNRSDFERVVPRLEPRERDWLLAALATEFPGGHEWARHLRESG